MKNNADSFSMGRRWLIFTSVLLLGVLSSICMFKAPPLFSAIIPELGFTDETIGWVMSMFAMIGIVLAFPASAILNKLGTKKSLILTGASFLLGSLLGAVANSVALLLVSRFIEGVGMGLISVVGGAAVASVIPARKQGLAMGIWSIWFPAGLVIAFNVSPLLYAAMGTWRAAWWFTVIVSVVALVFVAAVYADPPREEEAGAPADTGQAAALKPNMLGMIMAAVAFGAWNTVNGGAVSTFYPTFLADVHGLDTQAAGSVSSVTNICMLFLCPLMGFVADKLKAQKWLAVIGLFLGAVLFSFGFNDSMGFVWAFVALMGIASGACATGTFSAIPILAKDPSKVGLGMAFAAFFQNIGILAGSAAFAPISTSLGWSAAAMTFCVPICIVGGVCAVIAAVSGRKKKEA